MTRGSKKQRRMRSNRVFQGIFVGIILYLLLCVAGPFYLLLFKYNCPDLARIEPARYKPQLALFGFVEEDMVTAFSTYLRLSIT